MFAVSDRIKIKLLISYEVRKMAIEILTLILQTFSVVILTSTMVRFYTLQNSTRLASVVFEDIDENRKLQLSIFSRSKYKSQMRNEEY